MTTNPSQTDHQRAGGSVFATPSCSCDATKVDPRLCRCSTRPTHPTSATRRDLSLPLSSQPVAPEAWLLEYCGRVPGAVPARVEMAWPIEDLEVGTVQLRVEGSRRLSALGDRHGFTVVHCWWDVTGDELSVVAFVAWFPPAGVAAGELVLLEPEPVAA